MVLRSVDEGEVRRGQGVSQDQEHERDAPVVTRWLGVTTVSPDDLKRNELAKGASADRGESSEKQDKKSSHGKNSLTLQASIESEDRAGDVIRAEGWELDNYRLNPVVLWAHRHDLLPVGKSVDVWVENGALMATIEFAPTEFAQQVGRMFEEGFLRGVSVGFRALKMSPRSGNGGRGTVFERQELLEISAAPVPMHPFALAAGHAEAALGRGALAAGHPFALAAGRSFSSGRTRRTWSQDSASSAGHARASADGSLEPAIDESEQRELVPLFRELTELWQSVAGVHAPG